MQSPSSGDPGADNGGEGKSPRMCNPKIAKLQFKEVLATNYLHKASTCVSNIMLSSCFHFLLSFYSLFCAAFRHQKINRELQEAKGKVCEKEREILEMDKKIKQIENQREEE